MRRRLLAALSLTSFLSVAGAAPAHDGSHDFDFELGTWKTRVKRLVKPLTGSTTWVEMNGITTVKPVWGGRGNLVELEADGPNGHFRGLSLRLFNPQTQTWSLNFANAADGTLTIPTVGRFKDGRGEFFNEDTLGDKAIRVRFVITPLSPTEIRFEQAFSADQGKTWEVNWIATDTRVSDAEK
ncbi:MAG TPA: hypothetical protein VM146_05200 [Steroidobacteraceae bacterium]|nr:hypothetical protein [Steroidobacteraceae bacterium]